MSIQRRVAKYHGEIAETGKTRYRSWEHCYRFFREATPDGIKSQKDRAALQLGFYLASWGMYRGSSFLPDYDYTIHLGTVDCLTDPSLAPLWDREIGSSEDDFEFVPQLMAAINAVQASYAAFGNASPTLVTKVLLGTLGCLPACDTYFNIGFSSEGHPCPRLNAAFVKQIIRYCLDNANDLRIAQASVERSGGLRYPLMKVVDMSFFQLGYDIVKGPPLPPQ